MKFCMAANNTCTEYISGLKRDILVPIWQVVLTCCTETIVVIISIHSLYTCIALTQLSQYTLTTCTQFLSSG